MPRPRWIRTGQRLLPSSIGLSGTSGSPAVAAASTLAVRYPAGIDTPPTITDDVTPLSGQWHNYLALLIEAVMGELGPFASFGNFATTLKQFLGTEAGARLSLVRSVSKQEAGQIYGFMKTYVSGTGTYVNNTQTTNLTHNHGQDPFNRIATVHANTNQLPGVNGAAMVIGPAVVRGHCISSTSQTLWTVRYRGATAYGSGPAGSPTGAGTFSADLLLVFLPWI